MTDRASIHRIEANFRRRGELFAGLSRSSAVPAGAGTRAPIAMPKASPLRQSWKFAGTPQTASARSAAIEGRDRTPSFDASVEWRREGVKVSGVGGVHLGGGLSTSSSDSQLRSALDQAALRRALHGTPERKEAPALAQSWQISALASKYSQSSPAKVETATGTLLPQLSDSFAASVPLQQRSAPAAGAAAAQVHATRHGSIAIVARSKSSRLASPPPALSLAGGGAASPSPAATALSPPRAARAASPATRALLSGAPAAKVHVSRHGSISISSRAAAAVVDAGAARYSPTSPAASSAAAASPARHTPAAAVHVTSVSAPAPAPLPAPVSAPQANVGGHHRGSITILQRAQARTGSMSPPPSRSASASTSPTVSRAASPVETTETSPRATVVPSSPMPASTVHVSLHGRCVFMYRYILNEFC